MSINQGSYNTYIGARYVPIFAGEWSETSAYEPLTIVTYQGNSYTSRTYVPVGVSPTDSTYWAVTGNYNAQIEAYREEVANLRNDVASYKKRSVEWINVVEYGADNTGATPINSVINSINVGNVLYFPKGTYLLDGQLNIDGYSIYGDNAEIIMPDYSNVALYVSGNDITIEGINLNVNGKALYVHHSSRVRIRDVKLATPPTTTIMHNYALTLLYVDHSVIERVEIKQPVDIDKIVNSNDGIHIYGGCHDLTIRNVWGVTGDDFIALNCPEPLNNDNDIYNIYIYNVNNTLDGVKSARGIRLYCNTSKIYNVVIADSYLTSNRNDNRPLFVTNASSGTGDVTKPKANVSNIEVRGCVFDTPSHMMLLGNVAGSITVKDCSVKSVSGLVYATNCGMDSLTFDGVAGSYGTYYYLDDSTTTLDRLTIRNTSLNSSAFYFTGATRELFVEDCNIKDFLISRSTVTVPDITVSGCTLTCSANTTTSIHLSVPAGNISLFNNRFIGGAAMLRQDNETLASVEASGNFYSSLSSTSTIIYGFTGARLRGLDIVTPYAPTAPSLIGDVYFFKDTSGCVLRYFNGVKWVSVVDE